MRWMWLLFAAACCPAPAAVAAPAAPPDPPAAATAAAAPAAIALIETVPRGTTLGFDDVADTHALWAEMMARARERIDVAQFYISPAPHGGDRLEPVLAAMQQAAARGVVVRVLVDASFADTYPEPLERLAGFAELRRWDVKALMGGVQHAKYFVVDGREAYLGSANFDYRALEHIHELGLHIHSPPLVASLASLFAHDWAIASGETPPAAAPWQSVDDGGARLGVYASPARFLPDPSRFDLPRLEAIIAGAQHSLALQLLDYHANHRDGRPFAVLDDALRAAAARGVTVRIMVSDWQKRHPEALQALVRDAGIAVKLVTIPADPSGFIPYARVVHAKYLVADDTRAWIGTSNWQGDYFFQSRNAGVIIDGRHAVTAALARSFEQLWQSGYGEALDPDAAYTPPRIGFISTPPARSTASWPF